MNKAGETLVNQLSLKETVIVQAYRGDGSIQNLEVQDLIVNTGRTFLAQRIGGSVASAMAYMAVGTVTTAASLTDTTLVGEITRKALAVASATTNNIFQGISTFGGAADSVQSIAITEAGIFNHASSGNGTMFQRVTFASVTLADSDLLKVTLETNIGSNTI